MKLLFLRGQVPTDRPWQEIVFDELHKCDDMWTHLGHKLLEYGDRGEIWYWGRDRRMQWDQSYTERWIPSFSNTDYDDLNPDVIFARGGFREYDQVLRRFPNAYKIYYGAGKRFLPQFDYQKFDLVLVDTREQLEEGKRRGFNAYTWDKPAAENLFHVNFRTDKKYDFIVPSNWGKRDIKKVGWTLDQVRLTNSVIHTGWVQRHLEGVTHMGRIHRTRMPEMYWRSRVGLVATYPVDSAPRVISEALACGVPLVIHKEVKTSLMHGEDRSWGVAADTDSFKSAAKLLLHHQEGLNPRLYYDRYMSQAVAAKAIRSHACG